MRRYRLKVRQIQDVSEAWQTKAQQAGQELQELQQVFKIRHDEIKTMERIDGDCEGTFGTVFLGLYSGKLVAIKTLKDTIDTQDNHQGTAASFDANKPFLPLGRGRGG
eukprot:m.215665 g.215665  ORF g.215665 m.215665 type:complete len:108 (-) comp16978_c0_seq12:1414-1737(-)